MVRSWGFGVSALGMLALSPSCTLGRHLLLDKVLSDKPPPGQSDASCAHYVRVGLDEGVDANGRPIVEPEVHHLVSAMQKSWWQCASAVANALAKYGSEVEDAFQMEQRTITKHLNEIKSALEKGKPMQSISPAFEWAQSGDWVYINAKMSHKLDAPATLNVISEGVEMEERSLKFAAARDHKRFSLDLSLHDAIDPEPSTISFGSVGRVTFTLKKAKGGVKWPKLLADGQKKPAVNMHVWWTKQEEHSDELDDLEEAATAAAERAEKMAKEEGGGGAPEDGKVESGDGDADASKEGAAATENTMSPQRQLASKKKKVATAFAKEKRARFEELEKEKRAAVKSIDEEASRKKKEAEEALQTRKASIDEEFGLLVKKRHAEVEAEHKANERSEL
ncbi:unnamed protein product [Ectocarpus sp. 6 AP-2014]